MRWVTRDDGRYLFVPVCSSAVFIPVTFMGGTSGISTQFGVTMATSVGLSTDLYIDALPRLVSL
ncbi:MAG: hypothetical protein ACLR6J_12470 [Parabacteroides merdae]